jgi:hypothetical protein
MIHIWKVFESKAQHFSTMSFLNPGVFNVGLDGQVSIEFLADGGSYLGELGLFSLKGMENLQLGSVEFIQESARRILSNSDAGYLAISDSTEGAKFSGNLGEGEKNDGGFLGEKSFTMTAGEQLAFLLLPNGKIRELVDTPKPEKTAIFSISTANADNSVHFAQLLA